MSERSLHNLTVLGAGVLGSQIAWQSAFKGKSVVVYDLFDSGLEQCRKLQEGYASIYADDLGATAEQIEQTRSRLTFTTDLASSVAGGDIVIEAVPEIPEVKIETYEKLAELLPDHTILATNSSSMLPSQFAAHTGRPDRYCALHFANLIWALNLAEVMAHPGTSRETLTAVTRFAIEIGMVPIPIQKEQPAYVLNSLLIPLANAAQTLVRTGVASPETVDRTYMIMNRGCTAGPCGIMDVVGMNTLYNVFSHVGGAMGNDEMLANAAFIKDNFLDKGLLGVQTGRGFYTYPDPVYQAPDFLDVPEVSQADEIARLAAPGGSA